MALGARVLKHATSLSHPIRVDVVPIDDTVAQEGYVRAFAERRSQV